MKETKGNQSIEKSIRLIETLCSAQSPMRLMDISIAVDMPASTVLRMLNTLIQLGYAYQDNMKRYGLTLKFLHIGQNVKENFPYYELLHPCLVKIANETGETCCVANLLNNMVHYFDVVMSRENRPLVIRQQIGGSAYMHCTGSGKVFLCHYTEKQLSDLIATHGLPKLTDNTITTRFELEKELEDCRFKGYAMDNEEVEMGMRCLAVPIRDSDGKVVFSLSMSGPVSRMSMERCYDELVPLLQETAAHASKLIGG